MNARMKNFWKEVAVAISILVALGACVGWGMSYGRLSAAVESAQVSTSRNVTNIADHERRLNITETHMIYIRQNVQDIKAMVQRIEERGQQ